MKTVQDSLVVAFGVRDIIGRLAAGEVAEAQRTVDVLTPQMPQLPLLLRSELIVGTMLTAAFQRNEGKLEEIAGDLLTNAADAVRVASLGHALLSAVKTGDVKRLRAAVERFSQARPEYVSGNYPAVFAKLDRFLAPEAEPFNYSLTSYSLWRGGLAEMTRKNYAGAIPLLQESVARYRMAGLFGDAEWSTFDLVVCHLCCGDTATAIKLAEAKVVADGTSRFVRMADFMISAFQTQSTDELLLTADLLSDQWPGFASSEYPTIFENVARQLGASSTPDYREAAYIRMAEAIEMINLGGFAKGAEVLQDVRDRYVRIARTGTAARLTVLCVLALFAAGEPKAAKNELLAHARLVRDEPSVGEIAHALARVNTPSSFRRFRQKLTALVEAIPPAASIDLDRLLRAYREHSEPIAPSSRSARARVGQDASQLGRLELVVTRRENVYEVICTDSATVISGRPVTTGVNADDFEDMHAHLQQMIVPLIAPRPSSRPESLRERARDAGRLLTHLLLPLEVRQRLAALATPHNMILRLGDDLLEYNWEMIFDGLDHVCLRHDVGRMVSTIHMPTVRLARAREKKLRILLVGNPGAGTDGALPGADSECDAIAALFESIGGCELVVLKGAQATTTRIQTALAGGCDIFHYSGHVVETQRADPSLVLHNRAVRASTLRAFLDECPPLLAYINGCASGREDEWRDGPRRVFGLASAFLSAGCFYIGSVWPVPDQPAQQLAVDFYTALIQRRLSIGASLREARVALAAANEQDLTWGNYVFYGDPAMRLISR